METKTIIFDKPYSEKILKNLCAILKLKNIDYTCVFCGYDYIKAIKVANYYIEKPQVITTQLLFKVIDDNGLGVGLFDSKHLIEFLGEKL